MSTLDYLAFDLEIGPGDGQVYPVAVLSSPAGEARAEMELPFTPQDLDGWLAELEGALFDEDGDVDGPALAKEFGGLLFDALFTDEIRSRYDMSRQLARRDGMGLRIKLRINAPDLAVLPWELLYDPRAGEFVTLSRHTPIVRYLEVGRPVQALRVRPPLRILGMVASPQGLDPLDVDAERARMEQALAPLADAGGVELVWLEEATWRGLQQALQGGPWHGFHFIGHAGFDEESGDNVLWVADDQGRAAALSAPDLARLLADHLPLRLVVLNACEGARGDESGLFSSMAAALVERGLPAVLAMQYEISDQAAIEFSRSFYGALANGYPIDAATGEARKAISLALPDSLEWVTPVLFMRAADGKIWEIEESKEIGMGGGNEQKWWEKLGGAQAEIETGETGGDVIIATIGAGSRNVAVGKNITQQVYEVLGAPTPDDATVIQQQFEQLRAQLAALQKLQTAQLQVQLLEGELTKTGEDETPSVSTITTIGDWLLDNIPEIAEALASLFATPAVGRVVGKAGEAAVAWVKRRFGRG